MHYLVAAAVVLFLGISLIIFLVLGGLIIWPIINLIAYLKVLLFPHRIRRKYGTNIAKLTNQSFELAISDEEHLNIKKLKSSIAKRIKDVATKKKALPAKIKAVEEVYASKIIPIQKRIDSFKQSIPAGLSKNSDGKYSRRSAAGKAAFRTSEYIDSDKSEIWELRAYQRREITELENAVGQDEAKKNNEKDQSHINEIKNKPWQAWNAWRLRYARYSSNKASLIFMAWGFPLFFVVLAFMSDLASTDISSFAKLWLLQLDLYTYLIYVEPISSFFGVDVFKDGFFGFFLSYEYINLLTYKFSELKIGFVDWSIYAFTMPVLTFIVFKYSYADSIKETNTIEPTTY